jgi:SAM-dependent methyltransferase
LRPKTTKQIRRLGNAIKNISNKGLYFKGKETDNITYYGRLLHIDKFIGRELLTRLPKNSELSFLDLGCGPGQLGAITTVQTALLFKKLGLKAKIDAVDKEMSVHLYRKRREKFHFLRDINYIFGNLENYHRLHEKRYDFIRISNVFDYVRDKKNLTDYVEKTLRVGGILVTNGVSVDHYGELVIDFVFGHRIIQKTYDGFREIAVLPEENGKHEQGIKFHNFRNNSDLKRDIVKLFVENHEYEQVPIVGR